MGVTASVAGASGYAGGELLRLITEAGRQPFERDTLYRAVERTEAAFTILV